MPLKHIHSWRILICVVVIILIAGVARSQTTFRNYPPIVSFVQLLSHPEAYDGKKVVVFGFLHVQFEDSALYMSKTDADFIRGENSLWVSYNSDVKLQPLDGKEIVGGSRKDLEYFNGRYVTLEGTFNMKEHGHMGMFFGFLERVSGLAEARQWFDGRKQVTKFDKRGRIVPNRKSR